MSTPGLSQDLLVTLLEATSQVLRPLDTAVDLNLIEALAHATGLSSAHLVERELLRASRQSRLFLVLMSL